MIKLTEVCSLGTYTTNQKFVLRDVLINPEHVVMVREETQYRQLNEQAGLVEGLSPSHRFSKLIVNRGSTGSEIIVIGSPQTIEEKLRLHHAANKQLLKG